MLCVQEAIKGHYCFVITTVVGGRDQSVSLPNRLVTRHRLNGHQRQIVVQGDGDHDFALADHTLKR
jgi:hypothetical protein